MSRSSAHWAMLLGLGLFALSGCNGGDGELKGGPGATATSGPNAPEENKELTFSPSLSEEKMELMPGQREELTLSIDRGDQFQQKVNIEFTVPEGLKVLPESADILPGATETKVLLEAQKEAEIGHELALEVKFKPETGKSVSKVLKVTMQPREQPETEQPQETPPPAAGSPEPTAAQRRPAPAPVVRQPATEPAATPPAAASPEEKPASPEPES